MYNVIVWMLVLNIGFCSVSTDYRYGLNPNIGGRYFGRSDNQYSSTIAICVYACGAKVDKKPNTIYRQKILKSRVCCLSILSCGCVLLFWVMCSLNFEYNLDTSVLYTNLCRITITRMSNAQVNIICFLS